MDEILNTFVEDRELKTWLKELLNKLELQDLYLSAATGGWIGADYYYTFIFQDLDPNLEAIPDKWYHRQRENERASLLVDFMTELSQGIPQNPQIISLTDNATQITFQLN